MADVFISYKREEREAVQIIAERLASLRLDVWFDSQLRAGASFDEEIAQELTDAKAVLTCWTPAAIDSDWVRGEATMALQNKRLVACFLEPTKLIPPFNLIHAENLTAWAGQNDDQAWLKVLERIGVLVDRAGLATYDAVMRPGATIPELKAWANANGADPLVETIWKRVATIEGENSTSRLDRERREADSLDKERKRQAVRSRQLAHDRGLRDPKRERRRWLVLVGAVLAVALISAAGLTYVLDAQTRERSLRDTSTPVAVRRFLSANAWHPLSAEARQRLTALDSEAWIRASSAGSIDAIRAYIADAEQNPQGQFLPHARTALREAERVKWVQERLARLRVYAGGAHGALDPGTRDAIRRFRYRWMLPVSEAIDDDLTRRLEDALRARINPRLTNFTAKALGPPTEDDFMRIAERLGIDAATLGAVIDVETSPVAPAFGPGGRPFIVFEPRHFSRFTKGRFDETNPGVSSPRWDVKNYSRDQAGRWKQLEQAFSLDPEAAMRATAWGRFIIMGFNHSLSGFETVGEFVHFLSESEANQLEAVLLGFIRANKLAEALQRHDWAGFARRYHGPPLVWKYAPRLQEAYERRMAEVLGGERRGDVTRP